MKIRCPHCKANLNARDECKGKQARCPKCKQQFIITPLTEYVHEELCARCGRSIGASQQACVFQGQIVCADCDKKLREPSKLSTGPEEAPSSETSSRLKLLPFREANWVGIAVGALLMLVAFGISDEQRKSERARPLTPHAPIRMPAKPRLPMESDALDSILLFAVGVAFIVRSFLPGFTLLRGISLFFGGLAFGIGNVMVASLVVLIVIMAKGNEPVGGVMEEAPVGGAIGWLLACLLAIAFGIFSLRYAFKGAYTEEHDEH